MNCCCVEHTVKNLDAKLYEAEKSLEKTSELLARDLIDQYGYCSTNERENMTLYMSALRRHRRQLIKGVKPCLCCEEVQQLVENINRASEVRITMRTNVGVDLSQYDAWVAQNPHLVDYEEWENCVYACAALLKFDVQVIDTQKLCDQIGAVIDVQTVLQPNCDLDLDLTATTIECKLDPNVVVDTVQCKIDYAVLIETYDCSLTYDVYVKALQCGITHDVITQTLKCGIELDVTAMDDTTCVVSVAQGQVTTCCDGDHVEASYYADFGPSISDTTLQSYTITSVIINGVEQLDALVSLTGSVNVIDIGGNPWATNLADAINALGIPCLTSPYAEVEDFTAITTMSADESHFIRLKYPASWTFQITVISNNFGYSLRWTETDYQISGNGGMTWVDSSVVEGLIYHYAFPDEANVVNSEEVC